MMANEKDSPTRLYRDSERGMIFGVCAGVADYFGFRRAAVRWVTIILTLFLPMTAVVYLALAILLPRKPRELYKDSEDEMFWRSVRVEPHTTFARVRHRFRELDARSKK